MARHAGRHSELRVLVVGGFAESHEQPGRHVATEGNEHADQDPWGGGRRAQRLLERSQVIVVMPFLGEHGAGQRGEAVRLGGFVGREGRRTHVEASACGEPRQQRVAGDDAVEQ